jgi:hypothetical protein
MNSGVGKQKYEEYLNCEKPMLKKAAGSATPKLKT